MRILTQTRHSRQGFTLIELLAVIAIIGILASIVVPNVARYIAKAKVTKAVSEIKNLDTAMAGMLSDTGRANFRDFLKKAARDRLDGWSNDINSRDSFDALAKAAKFYNTFFYEAIRLGRDSDWLKDRVEPEVLQKLGTSYMDIGLDSWGNQYNFWMGPLRRGVMPLRSYRVRSDADAFISPNDPEFSRNDAYVYNQRRYAEAQAKFPGQPAPDHQSIPAAFSTTFGAIQAYGYPAPKDLAVYIWSDGANLESDGHLLQQMARGVDEEFPEYLGGGDDPNNWDNASGWENAPK